MTDMHHLKEMIDVAFDEHPPSIEALVRLYPMGMLQVRALLEIAKNLE